MNKSSLSHEYDSNRWESYTPITYIMQIVSRHQLNHKSFDFGFVL